MSGYEILAVLEEEGWSALTTTEGADFYQHFLTHDAVMILPGAGILPRDAAVRAIAAAPPWAWFKIEGARIIPLTEESAVIAYRATARRDGQPEYTALMSTVYVHVAGAWKIAFHQQTPL